MAGCCAAPRTTSASWVPSPPAGQIRSHGLFEGGELGWVEADGVVVQAGLILGEEEVGRVEGPDQGAAAAAPVVALSAR